MKQPRRDAPGPGRPPIRPEEDARFLPQRDGTDQPRCYGAARDLARPAERNDMLELQGLTRRYGDLVALDDLSFTVAEGQMFGFVGPNGAGKTTAMRIVLGVLEADAGQVHWRGQPMTAEMRKRLGYLPEDHGQTLSQAVRIPAGEQRAPLELQRGPQEADLAATTAPTTRAATSSCWSGRSPPGRRRRAAAVLLPPRDQILGALSGRGSWSSRTA
jgi:energy-coupling factor transporter ATP-binding protein EcfA2